MVFVFDAETKIDSKRKRGALSRKNGEGHSFALL
jgi:hypothetical protein